jgi:hypothetical protein
MRMPKDINLLDTYPYFYLDNSEFYVEATNFIITGNDLEVIFSYLVSDIGFYFFSKFYSGPQFDVTGFRYKKEYINNLYVPIFNQSDNDLLKSYFDNNVFDIRKINEVVEEILKKRIELDNDEMNIIKNYKMSLLSDKKA